MKTKKTVAKKRKLDTGDNVKPVKPTPVKEVQVYGQRPAPLTGTTPEYRARVDSTSRANRAAEDIARAKRGAPPLKRDSNASGLKRGGKVVKKKK